MMERILFTISRHPIVATASSKRGLFVIRPTVTGASSLISFPAHYKRATRTFATSTTSTTTTSRNHSHCAGIHTSTTTTTTPDDSNNINNPFFSSSHGTNKSTASTCWSQTHSHIVSDENGTIRVETEQTHTHSSNSNTSNNKNSNNKNTTTQASSSSSVLSSSASLPLPKTYRDAMVDNRPTIVTESYPPFEIVNVNEAWEKLCGYSRQEALQYKCIGKLLKASSLSSSSSGSSSSQTQENTTNHHHSGGNNNRTHHDDDHHHNDNNDEEMMMYHYDMAKEAEKNTLFMNQLMWLKRLEDQNKNKRNLHQHHHHHNNTNNDQDNDSMDHMDHEDTARIDVEANFINYTKDGTKFYNRVRAGIITDDDLFVGVIQKIPFPDPPSHNNSHCGNHENEGTGNHSRHQPNNTAPNQERNNHDHNNNDPHNHATQEAQKGDDSYNYYEYDKIDVTT